MAILLINWGCGNRAVVSPDRPPRPLSESLPSVGHTIQVGAFARIDNAVQLTEKLQYKGLDAYHFRDPSGLYKVRIGNYPSINGAREIAESLITSGIIDEYYLIKPNNYAVGTRGGKGQETSQKRNSEDGKPVYWGSLSLGGGSRLKLVLIAAG